MSSSPPTPIRALIDLAVRLQRPLSLEQILQDAVETAAQVLGTPRASIRLLHPNRTKLLVRVRAGSPLHEDPEIEFALGEGFIGWIAEQEQPIRLADAERDPRFVPRPGKKEPIGSFLGAPLLSGPICLGVLSAVSPERDYFTAEHEDLAVLLATLSAPHVQIAHLSRLSRVDHLTGVLNRYGLDSSFPPDQVAVADQLSLVSIDIDRFKLVNDTYGHAFGDKLLRRVSHLLGSALRTGDAVIRYGGDEFLLFLPGADLNAAARIAEQARALVGTLTLLHGEREVGTSLSAGVAQRRPDESREALIERADRALYAAKRAGRNRVEVAD